jgi:hypothetical protein
MRIFFGAIKRPEVFTIRRFIKIFHRNDEEYDLEAVRGDTEWLLFGLSIRTIKFKKHKKIRYGGVVWVNTELK